MENPGTDPAGCPESSRSVWYSELNFVSHINFSVFLQLSEIALPEPFHHLHYTSWHSFLTEALTSAGSMRVRRHSLEDIC